MSKYKICVYAISKNESKFVNRWMDSVKEADLVVVADTGSSDDTVEQLRNRGAIVYEEKIEPWRFDTARNVAMDHIPEDVDICVSIDIDEVFAPGWRAKLEQTWQPQHTRASYWYVWSQNKDESIIKKFTRDKIHRRHGFRWIHPVHEVLEYNGNDTDNSVFIDDIYLYHRPDPDKSRGQYLPLLELSAAENPEDDRGMFWLGREYFYYGRYDNAIQTLKRHLKIPSALWDEERSASMRFIAKSYLGKEDHPQAKSWLFRAVAECPHIREPWLELAKLGYIEDDWELCLFAAKRGLEITKSSNSYLVEPISWGFSLDDLAAIAYYRLGLYKEALPHAESACRLEPDDERLARNLELIRERLKVGSKDE